MDLFALLFGIVFGIPSLIFFIDGDYRMARPFIILFFISQLFWAGWFLPEKKVVTTITTDYYENMQFSKPVRITKTRTYRPLMKLSEKISLEVEVDGF